MTALTVVDLSEDQREAYSGIMTWLNRGTATKQTLSLGGFGGTGKSTVVSVLAHELLKLGPIAFCSFTGKAASVLSRKLKASGIETASRIIGRKALAGTGGFNPRPYCGTIHGLVYAPCDACMVEETFEHTMGTLCRAPGAAGSVEVSLEAIENDFLSTTSSTEKCLACDPPPPVKKEGPCGKCRGERFFRRSGLDRGYKLIINDEASMTSDDMLRDLLSYRVPLLAIGDHGQLPPVKGQGSLMRAPDLKLEKIHRQAEGNPIIALSAHIRETGDASEDFADGDRVQFMSARELPKWIGKRFPASRLGVDPLSPEGILGTVLVSWTNRQRVALNDQVREALGISGESPKKGEAMICLKNQAPIYNGMRGVLSQDAVTAGSAEYPQWKSDVEFVEDGVSEKNVCMAEPQFFNEKTIDYDTAREMGKSLSKLGRQYDFAYAITTHKFQGSSAPEVAVLMNNLRGDRDFMIRWKYTSVTRAESKLVCVM